MGIQRGRLGLTRRAIVGTGLGAAGVALLAACGAAATGGPAAAGNTAAGSSSGTSAQGAAGSASNAGSAGSAGGAANAPAAAAQTGGPKLKTGSTLVYWNDMGGPYPGLMQKWGEGFSQKVQVNVEVSGGIGSYGDKLSAAFAGGQPPDVYRYLQESIPLPAAVERNMLLKLDQYIKRDKYDLSDFRKDAIALYQWKGNQLALPRDYGLQLIFYNTEMLKKEGLAPIPTDWNDKTWTFAKLLEYCQRLTHPGDTWGMTVNRGVRPWASWVYSNGGALVKANGDGLATEVALADKPAVEALQFVQDLIYRYKVAPSPDEEKALGDQVELMQNGKLAMQINNPGANSRFRPSGMPYDVGVFPLGPSGTRRGVGGGGTGWAAAGPTKFPEEAWAFIQYITSRDAELGEVEIGQTTPSRTSVATGKEYLDPNSPPKGARVFADGQEYVVRDPVHSKWPDVQRDVYNQIMNDQLWTGKATALQMAKEIKDKGDPYFK